VVSGILPQYLKFKDISSSKIMSVAGEVKEIFGKSISLLYDLIYFFQYKRQFCGILLMSVFDMEQFIK